MRAAKSLVSLVMAVLVASVVALALALYLALAHRNLPLLRALVTELGGLLAGQRIEGLELDVRVDPDSSQLTGVATVSVRTTAPDRRHLYFLLNEGLHVDGVWVEAGSGLTAMTHYRFGPVAVATLAAPAPAAEPLRIRIAYRGNPVAGSLAGSVGVLTHDDILLKAEHFWYPTDLQGFFSADVRVTVPSALTLLHNGRETDRRSLGAATQVRWATPRPVGGLALVAGRYAVTAAADDPRFRVALPPGSALEPQPLLTALQVSERVLTDRYGPTGFNGLIAAVNPHVDRAFNDGTGVIGLSARYLSRGDYGFATIAHEVAHGWWGGTIAEKWLQPGTGGEWIVEGFAEFSSLLVVREQFGEAALLRRLERLAYDPTRSGALNTLSALDNALDPAARPTIYAKGAQATRMLQLLLGEDQFFMAARRLFERFGYRQASDADIEATFADETERDLSQFFATWIRSDAAFDIALDPQDGGAIARNHGTAWGPAALPVLRIDHEARREEETAELGTAMPLGNADRLLLDPSALTADMYRENNVFPPLATPRFIAPSARGELLIVTGEQYSWSPATIIHADANGQALHTWSFDQGVQPEPAWAADGLRILAVETDRNGVHQVVALSAADGSRKTIARDLGVSATADATIVARGDRLLRVQGEHTATILRHAGRQLSHPLVSPDQRHIAYVASSGSAMDFRVVTADGTDDRVLFTWPPADIVWRWAPSGAQLFVAVPGDWDWQLWELPVRGGSPRALVREAAAIGSIAVAPDGDRIAFTAVPTIDVADERHVAFVLDRNTAAARRFDLDGQNAHTLAWHGPNELLVIVSDPSLHSLPRRRSLQRLVLSDGSLVAFP